MTLERTQNAIDYWNSKEEQEKRYDMIMDLASEADLWEQFVHIPRIRIEQMELDKFMITIQGLAKIRELRNIAKTKDVQRIEPKQHKENCECHEDHSWIK